MTNVTTPRPITPEIRSIQVLRALAALLVVYGHSLQESYSLIPGFDAARFDIRHMSGVDVFFVLSGFIMIYIARFDASWRAGAEFFARRFLRISPMYYAFTLLMILVAAVMPSVLDSTVLDWRQVIASFFYFPYEQANGKIRAILGLGWSLNYEMFFYALFALGLLFRPLYALAGLTAVFFGLVVAGWLLDIPAAPFVFYTDPMILEFWFGMMVGVYYRFLVRNRKRDLTIAAALVAVSVVLLMREWLFPMVEVNRFLKFGVPATAVLFLCVAFIPPKQDAAIPSLPVALGNSSYALYLSHPFTLTTITLIWRKVGPVEAVWGLPYVIVCLFACTLVGHMVHLLFERPVDNYLRSSVFGSRRRQPVPRPAQ